MKIISILSYHIRRVNNLSAKENRADSRERAAEAIEIKGFKSNSWRWPRKANAFTDDKENRVCDIYNTGKKSIRLNIKHPDGMRMLTELLADGAVQ